MYHRYLPNAKGEYRRQSYPDAGERKNPSPKGNAPNPEPSVQKQPAEAAAPQRLPPKPHLSDAAPPPRFQLPFLDKLLPDSDKGDLLLLLIMLLLLSEGTEDAPSVAMTLGIFLFLQ